MLQYLNKTITVNDHEYLLSAERLDGVILVKIIDQENGFADFTLIADNGNFLSNLDQFIRSVERRRRARQIDNLQVLKDLDCIDLRYS